MITGEIKYKINSIWDDFFSAGMSEYLTVIKQNEKYREKTELKKMLAE